MLANEAEARISETGWRQNLVPLKNRFLDWWNGHTSPEASQSIGDYSDAQMTSGADQSAVQEPPWSRARLQTMDPAFTGRRCNSRRFCDDSAITINMLFWIERDRHGEPNG